jgi:methyl-accepting chemotaxis protein
MYLGGNLMSKLSNRLSMKAKLMLGFSILIVIATAVAMFNFNKMNEIEAQMSHQNHEFQDQLLAKELKEKVQLLETLKMEILFTKDLGLAERYEEEAAQFDQYITQISESASTRDEREWRAKLKTVSSEYQNGFQQAFQIIQKGELQGEALDNRLKQIYDISAIYKNYIFEIVDNFNVSYAQTSERAMQQSNQMLEETSKVSLTAAGLMLIVTVIVSLLLYRSFIHPIRRLQFLVSKVSEGDLTQKINSNAKDELGTLSHMFDDMIDRVQAMLKNTQVIAASLNQHSRSFKDFSKATAEANSDIVKAIDEISYGAAQQAASSEQSVQLIHTVNDEINDITQFTDNMKETSKLAALNTEKGSQSVQALQTAATLSDEKMNLLNESMTMLAQKTQQIGIITQTISDISSQTHVLSLNAAIEAASAGSHGKGFAVIAGEVRKLAKESNKASEHISEIILELNKQMKTSGQHMDDVKDTLSSQSHKVEDTLQSFNLINDSMHLMVNQIEQIHLKIDHTKKGNKSLVDALQGMNAIAEETAAGVEEVNATSSQQDGQIKTIVTQANDINQLAMNLFDEINKFKVESEASQVLKLQSEEIKSTVVIDTKVNPKINKFSVEKTDFDDTSTIKTIKEPHKNKEKVLL